MTNAMDTRFAFTRGIISDRWRLIQSEVGNRRSGKDFFKRKWLSAVNLRLSHCRGTFWQSCCACTADDGVKRFAGTRGTPLMNMNVRLRDCRSYGV